MAAISVIDGDTFRYGGETIRVADIDTPEVRGRCAYETQLAAQATRRMRTLLLEARSSFTRSIATRIATDASCAS